MRKRNLNKSERAETLNAPDEDKKDSAPHQRPHYSTFVLIALIIFYASLFGLNAYCYHRLPAPRLDLETPEQEFSEERAWAHLAVLESFGVRNVGSHANEVLAPKYLVDQLELIKREAPKGVVVEFDVQRVSGCFQLDFLEPFTSCYQSGIHRSSCRGSSKLRVLDRSAILLSAHYDSAPQVPAASDDLSNIAMMLEVLRAITKGPRMQHDVLFNFNGAEETILQASHGFITQHAWAKAIRLFLNFESAGGGGRALLFQVGPKHGWLVTEYAKSAIRPNGNSIAQDVFQSGIIPSDTDYRIYRDFGYIPGMDYAYIGNGYHYHTRRDDVAHFDRGSIQHCGDNILSLLNNLGNNPLVSDPKEHALTETVFFDILGLVMIVYPLSYGVVVNWALLASLAFVLVSGGWISRSTFRAFGAVVLGVLASTVFSASVGIIISASTRSMVWYSHPGLLFGLYLPACTAAFVVVYSWYLSQHTSVIVAESELYIGGVLFWIFLAVLLNGFNLASAYFPIILSSFSAVGKILSDFLLKKGSLKWSVVAQLAFLSVPVIYTFQLCYLFMRFFTPLMGRLGNVPVDVIVGVIIGLIAAMVLSISGSLFAFIDRRRLLYLLAAVFFVTFAYSFFLSPYDFEHPKRLAGFHTIREFHNASTFHSDSGIWTLAFDYLGMEAIRVPYLAELEHHELGCNGLYCDLPFFFPVRDIYAADPLSWYSPTAPPIFPIRPKLEILNTTFDSGRNVRRINARVIGTDHNALFIESHSKLKAWSFLDFIPKHKRESFFVFFASSHSSAKWDFWLEVEGNETIELAFSSHFMDLTHSPELVKYVNRLPSYVDPLVWSTYWARWTL